MKKVILVDSISELKGIRRDENNTFIALNYDIKRALKNRNIRFKHLEEFSSPDFHLTSLKWLKDWSDKKIYKNKSFKELVSFKEISLWWFVDFWLYYHPIHKDILYNLSFYITAVNNIIKREKPEKIILSKKNIILYEISKLVCKKKKITLEIIETPKKRLSNLKHKDPYFKEWLKNKKFSIRKNFSNFLNLNKKSNYLNKDILFFTYSSNWEKKTKDKFLGEINKYLKNINSTFVDIDYEPTIGLKGIIERKDSHIPFESFYDKKIKSISKKYKKGFTALWKNLDKETSFRDSFIFEGIDIYPLWRDKIKFIFTNKFPEAIKYLETTNKLFDKIKPKKIVLTDETSSYARAIIAIARIKKITSIGVTHGMINETAFEYMHKKNEVNTKSKNMKLCPIPDYTLVFGEYTKKLLTTKGGYKNHNIKVIGQPRYDFIADKNRFPINNKEKIFEMLNLNKNGKLVVFFSENISDTESGDLPHTVFKSMKKIKGKYNVNFVVKLHPREYYEHQKFYEELAKMNNIKTKVIKDINVFELINACDLGIVMHSNTGMEIAMLNKTLLAINLTNKKDIFPYVKEGVAIGAYKEEEIVQGIEKGLFDKKTKKRLIKNRDKFINYRLFRLDGKSAERAGKFIQEIVKK